MWVNISTACIFMYVYLKSNKNVEKGGNAVLPSALSSRRGKSDSHKRAFVFIFILLLIWSASGDDDKCLDHKFCIHPLYEENVKYANVKKRMGIKCHSIISEC